MWELIKYFITLKPIRYYILAKYYNKYYSLSEDLEFWKLYFVFHWYGYEFKWAMLMFEFELFKFHFFNNELMFDLVDGFDYLLDKLQYVTHYCFL